MADYRRCYVPGGSYFFTVVTERRTAILANNTARDCLRSAIRHCQHGLPFHVDAMVILPLCPLGMTISTPFGLCRPAIAIIPNAGALSKNILPNIGWPWVELNNR